jgi:hypothetical protein
MSRKNNLKHTIVNQSGATSFDTKLTPTNLDWLDNAGIIFTYTGNLVGTLVVYASNDKAEENLTRLPENWSTLDFGSAITGIDGTNTPVTLNLKFLPFSWIAIGYTATSGTGVITAKLTSKMVG